MSVCVADLLVGNDIRRASTFERGRVRNVHVCIAAHSASASRYKLAKCHIRFCLHLSAEPVSAKKRLTVFVLCVRPPPGV